MKRNNKKLEKVLKLHILWLKGDKKGIKADLSRANLSGADLSGADLSRADLSGADLSGANLRWADLSGTDLREANLSGANLREADFNPFQIVPEKGSFHAFKKVKDNKGHSFVIEIKILSKHKRTSSIVGRKCRSNGFKLVAIYNLEGNKIIFQGKLFGYIYPHINYNVKTEIKEPEYDDDIRIECTKGLHFFMTFKEARDF